MRLRLLDEQTTHALILKAGVPLEAVQADSVTVEAVSKSMVMVSFAGAIFYTNEEYAELTEARRDSTPQPSDPDSNPSAQIANTHGACGVHLALTGEACTREADHRGYHEGDRGMAFGPYNGDEVPNREVGSHD